MTAAKECAMRLDPSTDLGRYTLERLERDGHLWLIAVDTRNRPQPNPIWFVWDGDTILCYSQPDAKRLDYIRQNPVISIHFDATDAWADSAAILLGEAALDPAAPKVIDCPAYLAKYAEGIARLGMTPQEYSDTFSAALRVRITSVRGYVVAPGENPTL